MPRKLRLEFPRGVLPRNQSRQLPGGDFPERKGQGGVRGLPVRGVRQVTVAAACLRGE